jgi:cystathionine beta-synthase
MEIAKDLDEKAVIVTLACDSGQRYLSKMYSDEWMREQGYDIEEKKPQAVSLEQRRQI